MNDFEKMAELLLPSIDKSPDYYENLFPARNLPEGARVVRIAPSPTGYLHIGTLYMAMVNRLTANATKGIFFTRIEDTDKKREIEGGIDDIINGIKHFGVKIDEGFISGTEQIGNYGPYKQSERAAIYQCYAKELIKQGLAYPCFCTAEDLDEIRKQQEAEKIRTGYHGKWARHRDITYDQAKELVDKGLPFVVRLKSPGNEENKIFFEDGVKGKIEMPENDEDFVLLKSDGIPTYHFAHAIDDHLMHTTHVMRGDEWISSVPKHIQLFKLLGFKPPKFVHPSPIMKSENGAKRKISKRKDPEAAMFYFIEQGYVSESVMEYLMTIASSEFEQWRKANKDESYWNFPFNIKKMSPSGALFDMDKLNDISKNVVSRLSSSEVYELLTEWAKQFDKEFFDILTADSEYTKAVFAIDRDCDKPRKDIAKWSDAKDYCAFFFDKLYTPCFDLPEKIQKQSAVTILSEYLKVYDENDDKQEWFNKIKAVCPAANFADDTKLYKANPELYAGNPADASTIIRVAITGRTNTPDLCSIMKVLGKDVCVSRIMAAIENYNK